MTSAPLQLTALPQQLAVCRLPPESPIPAWAAVGPLWSLTRTPDELSLVCAEAQVPPGVTAERGWRALVVAGPLDFALTGILHAITGPLAVAAISIFALSTYDTDYVLIRASDLERAVAALRAAGHTLAA